MDGATNAKPLTGTNIRYILAIHRLDVGRQGVRCIDIARALGLRKPTVHSMLGTLIKTGLVAHDHGGAVRLTEQGWALAEQYADCFRAATRLFGETLALPAPEAVNTGYALLAETPPERLAELATRLGLLLANKAI